MELESKNYTILHLHSMLSNAVTNIDSVTAYSEYIQKAHDLGMSAMAFSEHGSVMGWVKKKLQMEELGMKYIHAEEFYLTQSLEEKMRDNYHCLLIAKNYDGVMELNKLSTKSFNREDGSYYYAPRITIDDVKNTSDNIIVSTACLGGVLNKAPEDVKKDFFEWIVKNKHRCYLELQPHLDDDQIRYNQSLWALSKNYGVPLVMCTDTHALNSTHVEGRTILQKSKNIHFDGEDKFHLEMLSYEELVNLCRMQNALPLSVYLEAIENTNRIADQIETFNLNYEYKYPHLWGDNSEEVLREKIRDGIKWRGVDKLPNYQEYLDRIEYEMKAYIHNGAIDFMLLMEDIISWCKTQDILVGYGRGSCNGSIVAYLLGITEMDSIKHGLNFDRFMNTERVSLSDIDTDFPPSRINEVKQYIFTKPGLYCSDIVTFNTIALKGAIRDVGRALGIPLTEVSDICNKIELDEASCRKAYPELFKYVDIVNGCVVSVGNHPCFTGDTLVLTSNGYAPIQDVKTGDSVLTHKNRWATVEKTMSRQTDDIAIIYPSGSLPITTTPNHPFLVRHQYKERYKKYKNGIDTARVCYYAPEWCDVDNIKKGDVIGYPVNINDVAPEPFGSLPLGAEPFWWLVGRYLGDGWIGKGIRHKQGYDRYDEYLVICCAHDEQMEIIAMLDAVNFNYRIEKRPTADRIYIKNREMLEYLRRFGDKADGKFVPNFVIDMPKNLLQSFFDGYMSADGSYLAKNNSYSFRTVSKKLMLGMIQVVAKLYHRHCCITITKDRNEIICGREVHCKEKYSASFTKDRRRTDRNFYESGYIWCRIKSIEYKHKQTTVYNLSVLDDNSYTVNNIAVHNCGLVVSPVPIDDKMGLFTTSTDDVPISQINMKEIDLQNYVKLDLLKLDTIELINETCKLANIERLTPDNIDVQDEEVWHSLRDDTTEIFQWNGSTGDRYIKHLLSDNNIKKFKSLNPNVDYMTLLSIGNGAIRPAGASYRDDLAEGILRKSGNEAIDNFMKNTFGYLVFQEQIIQFLHEYCGYTMGEADIVRRHFAKKTGTEKDIPQIKEGFAKTMAKDYGMSREESEEVIADFIQVIEDASNYLFSLNHSQPYSYMGYASAWLRYYYPVEFITTAFNLNRDKEEKTNALIAYAHKMGIKINSPKFRFSRADYFCDSVNRVIYKGLGSIKHMSAQVAEDLYTLRDEKFSNFIDLLYAIQELPNKPDSRQLDILVKIGYFQEFGNAKALLTGIEVFNKFYKCKTIKVDKFKEMGYNIDDVMPYVGKATEKTLSQLDNKGIILALLRSMKMPKTTAVDMARWQCEYLGYCSISNPNEDPSNWLVLEIKKNNYGTSWAKLWNICYGCAREYRLNKKFAAANPVEVGDYIKAVIVEKPKYKKNEDGSFSQVGNEVISEVKCWKKN